MITNHIKHPNVQKGDLIEVPKYHLILQSQCHLRLHVGKYCQKPKPC